MCILKPNLLVLILTTKNRKFGGFTKIAWSGVDYAWGPEGGTSLTNCFIFSLDKMKKYLLKPGKTHTCVYNRMNGLTIWEMFTKK